MAQPILSRVTKNGLQYMILLNEDAPPTLWSAKGRQWDLVATFEGRYHPYKQHAAFALDLDDGREWQIALTDGSCVFLASLDGRRGPVLQADGEIRHLSWIISDANRKIVAITNDNCKSGHILHVEHSPTQWDSYIWCEIVSYPLQALLALHISPNGQHYLAVMNDRLGIGTFSRFATCVLTKTKFTRHAKVAWSTDSTRVVICAETSKNVWTFDTVGWLENTRWLSDVQDIRWLDASKYVIATSTHLYVIGVYPASIFVVSQMIAFPQTFTAVRISPDAKRLVGLSSTALHTMGLRSLHWNDRIHASVISKKNRRVQVFAFMLCVFRSDQVLPTELCWQVLQILFTKKFVALLL